MENRETRERAFEEGMRKRHQIAMTGVRLERMVWQDGADFFAVRAFISQQRLPEVAQEKLLVVIDNFEAQERALDDMQRELEEKLGFRIQDDPERAGKLYFEAVDKYCLEPKGRITLTREPGYFKLFFEKDEDFDELYPYSDGRAAGCAGVGIFRVTPNLLDPTYRRRYENRLEQLPGSHFELYRIESVEKLKIEGLELPDEVIFRGEMTLMSLKGKADLQRSLFEHERQHIIYSQFRNESDPFDGIRDEYLAQIRGNHWPGSEILDSPSYSKHEHDLDEGKRKELRTLLDTIKSRLHKLPEIFGQPATRALLTYHLLDLSLEQMPERITSLGRFYGPYLRPFSEYQPPTSYEDEYVATVSDIRYGFSTFDEPMQALANQVVATYDAWMDGFDDATHSALATVESSHTQLGVENVRKLRDSAITALRRFQDVTASG